jgi:hypothetical protein
MGTDARSKFTVSMKRFIADVGMRLRRSADLFQQRKDFLRAFAAFRRDEDDRRVVQKFKIVAQLFSTVWFQWTTPAAVVTSEACASLSREVSNRVMRHMILSLWILLLNVCSWPQPSSTNKTEKAAIRRDQSRSRKDDCGPRIP